MAFCFAVIGRVAAITLKTISDARAEFLGSTFSKWKWLTILDGDLKITFNLQYGKVVSVAFCSTFWISNYLLLSGGKTQTNSFFGTIQIFGCLINTLSK